MIVLAIDIQHGITNERLYDFDGFLSRVTEILDTARENNVEVIYVQHDDGPGSGFSVGDKDFEIAQQVTPKNEEKVFTKVINSCFGNKELADYLEKNAEGTLMVVGLQTDYCMDATIKSAFERGYKVLVPQGTNSTFDNAYMDKETTYRFYNEMMWPKRYADCISMEEAIALLNK